MLNDKFKELKITSPDTLTQEDFFNTHSFLNDELTINFIKKSKIMFILRGLPGSGKSTLTKAILNKYPASVVCSADLYFTNKQTGEYKHDINKLKDAHLTCQMNAKQACKCVFKFFLKKISKSDTD
jgi:ABC-type dipeptide/oligopeptide/nickel transport system ATPase component